MYRDKKINAYNRWYKSLLKDLCFEDKSNPILAQLDACLKELAPFLDDNLRYNFMYDIIHSIYMMFIKQNVGK